MYTDFKYDGLCLSDFGFMICEFDRPSGTKVISAGSKITFNTISLNRGQYFSLTGTQYTECLQAEFAICKDPCKNEDKFITEDECRKLKRWLNRHEFLPFNFIPDGDDTSDVCYYDASFNLDKIKVADKLCGLKLTLETNRPFGYGEEQTVLLNITDVNNTYQLSHISDEIGYIYPSMTITCNEAGNLSLYNEFEDCTMVINNCSVGEVIVIDGITQIITSSLNRDIYDDFNFEFFKIGNTMNDRINKITSSLLCTLEFKYTPIIKDAPESE